MMEKVFYSSLDSPFGLVFVAKTINGVCLITFSGISEVRFLSLLRERFKKDIVKDGKGFGEIKMVLRDYFRGRRKDFKLQLDLSMGTQFQRKVWSKVMDIPYGELRSYKWVASAIGSVNASRAVGNAVGANPVPPIVPCHRVVCSDGSLGGYTSGVTIKKRLLKLEGVSKVGFLGQKAKAIKVIHRTT